MIKVVKFKHIDWDFDDDDPYDDIEVSLPTTFISSVEIPDDIDLADNTEISEFLCDWLSDMHGYCVNWFEYEILGDEENVEY